MAQKIELKKAVWFESLKKAINLKCFGSPYRTHDNIDITAFGKIFTTDESTLILYALCFLDFEWKAMSKKEISEFCGFGKNGTRVKKALQNLHEKGIIVTKTEIGKSLNYFKLGETFNIK
jgi:hypothetical protein